MSDPTPVHPVHPGNRETSVSEAAINDVDELQEVLTRYIDSRNGYRAAADEVDYQALANTMLKIAKRRNTIAETFSELIAAQGYRADVDGSNEAKIHRWWIHLRAGMSNHEISSVIHECLRGETELEKTLRSVRENPELLPEHLPLIEAALEDIKETVADLEAADNLD